MKNTDFHTFKPNHIHPLLQLLGQFIYSDLKHQIEYLKTENEILRLRCNSRIRLTDKEKIQIIKFAKPLGANIKKIISIVNYSTYRRWLNKEHNAGKPSSKLGRPRKTTEEITAIILHMAKNTGLGYTKIIGELKKLGISISRSTVKNIFNEYGLDTSPNRSEDSWDKFIKRTFTTLWACDFFSKTIWTPLGPQLYFVLFFINIHTRKVHIAGITKNPNKAWIIQSLNKMQPVFQNSDDNKLIIRDGDKKFPKEFDQFFKDNGFNVTQLPFRSPNLNPYAESWVSIIKRECLDYFCVFGEHHLKFLVNEFVKYYNTVRPHSALNNMPLSHIKKTTVGTIKHESRLGGLLNHYYRE